jgi:hypothetical protein
MDTVTVLKEIDTLIDQLHATTPHALTPTELDAAVVLTGRVTSRLASARARLIGEWTRQKRWATDGSRSAGARLANEHREHCSAVS